jgi:hypothetical protein
MCSLDEPDKHFSHNLLLYFAFFVKWVRERPFNLKGAGVMVTKFHLSAASANKIRSITVTFLVSTPNSKYNSFILLFKIL